MTAQSIGLFTIYFPDPSLFNVGDDRVNPLNANISFQYPITSNIQTLSPKDVQRGNDPYGILYVPDLSSSGCRDAEQEHVPSNATRLNNLPSDTDYALVAFAPWFSPTCMLEYFQAARSSTARAFLVYLPGNDNTMPPVMNDHAWYLGDGGSWKMNNTFPTYAISSSSGSIIARELSFYSGNVSNTPYSDEFPAVVNPTDYVRLWASIDLESNNQLPSLWVFLVIVLGLLILVIGTTSIMMHLVQRRRRNSLRQRVINGEVNLETLGIKRVVVPREFLEKMPLYSYSSGSVDPEKAVPQPPAQAHNLPSPTIDAETGANSSPLLRCSSAPTVPPPTDPQSGSFSQSTCPICLDDFEPIESQIRELPCHHIFHADCIDPFLLKNSSLCPLCKQSVLPTGYCPTRITNIMVRRERIIRRMRARNAANGANGGQPLPASTPIGRREAVTGFVRSRVGGTLGGRRIFSAPERTQTRPPDIEMANSNAAAPPASSNAAPLPTQEISPVPAQPPRNNSVECTTPPSPSQPRGEWARQRALMLLGNRNVPGPAEDEENTGPRWKRGLRKLFPGFR
ncbi:hypothetical protein K458DRAFT_84486 [Lentithecium fluviatile CBS 122367]|uniref:RING-type domain-containing protein n=1 Tax=Lentithecium fluviatile CBS 122367 TaxID=1168545 RepID=A0A6G1ISL3_9PLEO|nr:hypothetical protein K458DRAFT_84486 [Lentithecium fluviatile CBS 122367]